MRALMMLALFALSACSGADPVEFSASGPPEADAVSAGGAPGTVDAHADMLPRADAGGHAGAATVEDGTDGSDSDSGFDAAIDGDNDGDAGSVATEDGAPDGSGGSAGASSDSGPINSDAGDSGAVPVPDAGPESAACECSSGTCCDGCHFRDWSYVCGEAVYETRCRVTTNCRALEQGYRASACNGDAAECTRWGSYTFKWVSFGCGSC